MDNLDSNRSRNIGIIAVTVLLIGILLGALLIPALSLLQVDLSAYGFNTVAVTASPQENTLSTIAETAIPAVEEDGVTTILSEPEIEVEAAIEDVVPATTANSAAQFAGLEMEDRLIALYEQVNPAVVFIFNYDGELPLGTGTGFLSDSDGHIITNNHVVQNGDRYEVLFPSGHRMEATLVGTDVDSDLAVIRVPEIPAGVNPLTLGDSAQNKIGQFVVAIGNPFGQQSSMSLGIISGLERTLPSQRVTERGRYSLPDVIQTDAPINPGNSGGPLLNLNGEVVGINSAIRSETGSNSGVGFAVPINIAHRVVPSIIANGRHVYPFLGISMAPALDLTAQEALGLPQTNGVYITAVASSSPAGDAGLRGAGANNVTGGDFVVAINGAEINDTADLTAYLVYETEVGETITMTVYRDGEFIDVDVVLGERP